jgi:hypothetical protein
MSIFSKDLDEIYELKEQKEALIVALERCIGSLRTVSPGGDGDPDVVFAREAIEEARKIK